MRDNIFIDINVIVYARVQKDVAKYKQLHPASDKVRPIERSCYNKNVTILSFYNLNAYEPMPKFELLNSNL
ncbi:MAG: hypothetical protein FWC91_10025 [Defluviitaleaceae bacterium]|nr:hypothetical protein [Defluviitaleaceae bacterium]